MGLKRNDILEIFKDFSKSQGFYGRLLNNLNDLKENDPSTYEKYMKNLEDHEFKDVVDLVLYIES